MGAAPNANTRLLSDLIGTERDLPPGYYILVLDWLSVLVEVYSATTFSSGRPPTRRRDMSRIRQRDRMSLTSQRDRASSSSLTGCHASDSCHEPVSVTACQ